MLFQLSITVTLANHGHLCAHVCGRERIAIYFIYDAAWAAVWGETFGICCMIAESFWHCENDCDYFIAKEKKIVLILYCLSGKSCFFHAALLLLSNQTVLLLHLVLHMPVLQKVKDQWSVMKSEMWTSCVQFLHPRFVAPPSQTCVFAVL